LEETSIETLKKNPLHQVEKYYLLLQKQTKGIVAEKAKAANMPYITEEMAWWNAN
jgi:hypothetical protein